MSRNRLSTGRGYNFLSTDTEKVSEVDVQRKRNRVKVTILINRLFIEDKAREIYNLTQDQDNI